MMLVAIVIQFQVKYYVGPFANIISFSSHYNPIRYYSLTSTENDTQIILRNLYKTKSHREQVAEPRINHRLVQLQSPGSNFYAILLEQTFFLEEPVTIEVPCFHFYFPGLDWVPCQQSPCCLCNCFPNSYWSSSINKLSLNVFITTVPRNVMTNYSHWTHLWKGPTF